MSMMRPWPNLKTVSVQKVPTIAPPGKTGAVLISTTQMMPQLLQADFGYTALLAAGDHGAL